MDSQEFFSKVTKSAAEYKPLAQWKPRTEFSLDTNLIKTFGKYEGAFERHIATSIPLYRDLQFMVAESLLKTFKGFDSPSLWDIGGSEGSWVKMLAEHGFGKCAVLDCNPDMQEYFNTGVVPEGASFHLGDFSKFGLRPPFKADVVHAGMAFQFMNLDRPRCINRSKELFLEEGGLFLVEEKVIQEDINVWVENEVKKDGYKNQFYTREQIETKGKEVLKDMHSKLVLEKDIIKWLEGYFCHIHKYYQAGNFVGYACSDNYFLLAEFIKNMRASILKY